MTALPVIETQAGDVSAYIPTNVISITDGQIYLEPNLFNAGIRPALNVGISVSRVGGNAQIIATKKVAGPLKLELAQFRALEAFAKFGSDLDKHTMQQIKRGQVLTEMLKQPQYSPMPVEQQVVLIVSATSGALDNIPTENLRRFELEFIEYMKVRYQDVLDSIADHKEIIPETQTKLTTCINEFCSAFMASIRH